MILGIIFAIMAGLLWGMIFVGPLLIPEYPGVLQASGRYIVFGIISLALSWNDRKRLCKLLLQDWMEAIKLVLAGHLIYYTCLASAIQCIGAPLSTAIIGTLPLVITLGIHFFFDREQKFNKKLSIYSIYVSIVLIGSGLLCVNISELQTINFKCNVLEYIMGVILAMTSVVCWAWYALKNTYWLKTHPHNKPITWSNAQGIVTLPLSCSLYCIICIYFNYIQNEFVLPFGPNPTLFIFLMILIGFFCSWLGTYFWNEASQRLPAILIGPLIVCETVAGLAYAFIYRGIWPDPLMIVGIILLIFGVSYVVYSQNY